MKMRREVKVGLYALIMLAALYWGVNFLRGKDIFHRTDTYYATYEQVNGIQKSSSVMIKGFKVGVVGDIKYDPKVSDQIVLELNIDSDYRIPENSQARVFSDGLLGGKAIEIVLGNSGRYLSNRDTLRSVSDPDILEVAGSELERITFKVTHLADNLTKTISSLNEIINQNKENINTTLANVSQVSGSLNYLISSEKDNIRDAIYNINTFSQALSRNAGNLDMIMADLADFSDTLADVDLREMTAKLTGSLGELNMMMAGINDGEGSLGKLATDKALYDSLAAAAGNLSALLEDLKANPGRYVNITIFGGRNK